MNSIVALITFSFTLHVSYSWTSMSVGGMKGVTYAGGTIYNRGTMCPSNANQGYVCDGRNFGDKNLDAGKLSSFCSGYTGSFKQIGFGHGVTAAQKCGDCVQIRVPRTDGTYNYMTVMMVDHFTWSMEVGTTEIVYLVDGTSWQKGDYAGFDYRIVGDYDCYASFDGDTGGGSTPTTTTTTAKPTPKPTQRPNEGGGGGGGNGGDCGVTSDWGAMKVSPYWGSSRSSMYAVVSNPPTRLTSFAIRGADQNNNQFQTCVFQNTNSYQCNLDSPLTEPASVKINGRYYGIDIIESMTGSAKEYPLSTCTGRFTFDDEDNKSGVSWTVWFAICVIVLLIVAAICGVCFYTKRGCFQAKKGYISDHDTIQLKDDDGANTTQPNNEMINIKDENEDEPEIEIEVEAETGAPITLQ